MHGRATTNRKIKGAKEIAQKIEELQSTLKKKFFCLDL